MDNIQLRNYLLNPPFKIEMEYKGNPLIYVSPSFRRDVLIDRQFKLHCWTKSSYTTPLLRCQEPEYSHTGARISPRLVIGSINFDKEYEDTLIFANTLSKKGKIFPRIVFEASMSVSSSGSSSIITTNKKIGGLVYVEVEVEKYASTDDLEGFILGIIPIDKLPSGPNPFLFGKQHQHQLNKTGPSQLSSCLCDLKTLITAGCQCGGS